MRSLLLLTFVAAVCSVTVSLAVEPASPQQASDVAGRQLVDMFHAGFGRGANLSSIG